MYETRFWSNSGSYIIGWFLHPALSNNISLERTFPIRKRYRRSDNPIKSYQHLSEIFMLFWSWVLNITMEWFLVPSSSTSLQRYWSDLPDETSISTIWQSYQVLWLLKCNFHTFFWNRVLNFTMKMASGTIK